MVFSRCHEPVAIAAARIATLVEAGLPVLVIGDLPARAPSHDPTGAKDAAVTQAMAASLLLTSVAFGAGHTLQGLDIAVATGVPGGFWGVLYLTRGSVVAAAVSHGLFNLGQVVIAYTLGDALAPTP